MNLWDGLLFTSQSPAVVALFRVCFGLVLFGELSDGWTWAGAVIIFGSSYYIARRESRNARRPDPA